MKSWNSLCRFLQPKEETNKNSIVRQRRIEGIGVRRDIEIADMDVNGSFNFDLSELREKHSLIVEDEMTH